MPCVAPGAAAGVGTATSLTVTPYRHLASGVVTRTHLGEPGTIRHPHPEPTGGPVGSGRRPLRSIADEPPVVTLSTRPRSRGPRSCTSAPATIGTGSRAIRRAAARRTAREPPRGGPGGMVRRGPPELRWPQGPRRPRREGGGRAPVGPRAAHPRRTRGVPQPRGPRIRRQGPQRDRCTATRAARHAGRAFAFLLGPRAHGLALHDLARGSRSSASRSCSPRPSSSSATSVAWAGRAGTTSPAASRAQQPSGAAGIERNVHEARDWFKNRFRRDVD